MYFLIQGVNIFAAHIWRIDSIYLSETSIKQVCKNNTKKYRLFIMINKSLRWTKQDGDRMRCDGDKTISLYRVATRINTRVIYIIC